MSDKVKWPYEAVIGKRKVYARVSRTEIIVRVENVGDVTKYAEWCYPKLLGLVASAHQAALEVPERDIKP